MKPPRPLPLIGAPATGALEEAGVRNLDEVRRVGLDHLATLHGRIRARFRVSPAEHNDPAV